MKTKRIINAIFGEVNVTVPTAWSQINQKELHYIYFLRSKGVDMGEVKRLFFLRKAGMNPVREAKPGVWLCQCGRSQCYVNVVDLALAVDRLSWMDELPAVPLRLEQIQGVKAVSPVLHGVSFGDYLSMENLYQGFILSQNTQALRDLAKYLYPGVKRGELTDLEIYNIVQWFGQIKMFFAKKWPDLFATSADGGGKYDPEAAMNAQIRALTGGDVLKENAVLKEVDVWRALTELNEKAREAAEIKEKMK